MGDKANISKQMSCKDGSCTKFVFQTLLRIFFEVLDFKVHVKGTVDHNAMQPPQFELVNSIYRISCMTLFNHMTFFITEVLHS